jgi:hypothetical protein
MSVATILVLYSIGIAIPALTPVPAFATEDDTNYNTNDNTNDDTNYNTNDNTNDDTDDNTNDNTNDDTDDNTNDNNHDILLFLIDVVECFTIHDEEFSDDVQLCLYDVIDDYFDNVDNNLNNNNNISSNDNNNNGTSSQET